MRSSLENEWYAVEADTTGAELARIFDKKRGQEILWQGSPTGWTGRAPILFPVVGALRDNGFFYQGKRYALEKHGFAEKAEFTLTTRDPALLRYRLQDSAETLASYPFPFSLTVSYRLDGDKLQHRCAVENTGPGEMFFSLGFHPAFHWGEGDWLEIAGVREAQARRLNFFNQFLLTREKESLPFEQGRLYNTPALFPKGAWIFDDLPGAAVSLVSPRRKLRVRVEHDAPCLGIWGWPGAPFAAIEPWHGIDDMEGTGGNLEEKPFIQRLAPGETWEAGIVISVEDSGEA